MTTCFLYLSNCLSVIWLVHLLLPIIVSPMLVWQSQRGLDPRLSLDRLLFDYFGFNPKVSAYNFICALVVENQTISGGTDPQICRSTEAFILLTYEKTFSWVRGPSSAPKKIIVYGVFCFLCDRRSSNHHHCQNNK